ncbi:hypothetical protein BBOV_I001070 [Babesia bovis T2Bo]|uniref:Uncharacterized protein n=1 Tax=Babesia bovis TaxID=5865 RepID=A7AXC7_BABBO|nr:hypothetical protein BBOV_I001070 [Babesia bovis T2Bo]EDO05200.1 hypothetical protein BBOV_I001070 [Babesia bovis T2Bo]BAN65693.1 hypothetical protein [Babesia bovis]|eukprot:XP_001608768.1 hypothetical protein [Babesia bovis T2Bo]
MLLYTIFSSSIIILLRVNAANVDVLREGGKSKSSLPDGSISEGSVTSKSEPKDKRLVEPNSFSDPVECPSHSIDADDLYKERYHDLDKFDRFTYRLWKRLFRTGSGMSRGVWNAICGMGDGFLSMCNTLKNTFPNAKMKNPYTYGDYEEEFDVSLDKETSDYLQKQLESKDWH